MHTVTPFVVDLPIVFDLPTPNITKQPAHVALTCPQQSSSIEKPETVYTAILSPYAVVVGYVSDRVSVVKPARRDNEVDIAEDT